MRHPVPRLSPRRLMVLCLIAFGLVSACGEPETDVTVVQNLELERYDGLWYERASFPQSFQEGCFCTTAEYEIRESDVAVINRCRIDSPDGERNVAEGRAYRPDPDVDAKLKVEFFFPFAGDYWVTELGNDDGEGDYTYAVVTNPTKEYFWILSRDPLFSDERIDEIEERYAEMGWDMSKLERTSQAECVDE